MAMEIGLNPNPLIHIRFHGSGSKKIRPFGSEWDPDPFVFHESKFKSQKKPGPRTVFIFINIKYYCAYGLFN